MTIELDNSPSSFFRGRWENLDLQTEEPIKNLMELRTATVKMGLVDPTEGTTWYTIYGLSRDGPNGQIYVGSAPKFVAYTCNREARFIVGVPNVTDYPDGRGYTVRCGSCDGELDVVDGSA